MGFVICRHIFYDCNIAIFVSHIIRQTYAVSYVWKSWAGYTSNLYHTKSIDRGDIW